MTALPVLMQSYAHAVLASGGFAIGFGFGLVAARANFCVMGAIADFRTFAGTIRLGAVGLAIATALIVTQLLAACNLVPLAQSVYLAPRFDWLGASLGGLIFGAGMVYAGGCTSRNLIRAGHGDVRSLLVLLCVAVSALATISGVLAPVRAAGEAATAITSTAPGYPIVSLDALLGLLGLTSHVARSVATALAALPFLAFAFGYARVQREPVALLGGMTIGLLVAAGWLITGLAYDDMAVRPIAPHSLSFVRPTVDAIDWLQRSTALGLPGFGAASIFGALMGSAAAALAAGRFEITFFHHAADVRRHLGGAVAMGVGGVLALGCSIGQGITGISTLSLQSMLAAAAMFSGAWLALRHLERSV